MQDELNWGILGASNFARRSMGPALAAAGGSRLRALATTHPGKAEGFRAFCPDLAVHTSYEALLDDPGIEAVYIPLPNNLHAEWALKAAAAGKHVLVEKPAAMCVAEVDRLIAARDASRLLVAEAFMIVHHPQWILARKLVQEGEIGTLGHVDVVFTYDNRDGANIRNRAGTGGGGIRDIGVYAYGAARFVTGAEPDDLHALIRMEDGVDTFALATGTFKGPTGGFTYAGITSMRLASRQEAVFQGDRGLVKLTAPFNAGRFGEARVELHRGSGMTVERFPVADQYRLQVEAFCRSVRTGEAYACPLEFSRGTQAMIDRVFEVADPV